MIRVMLVEDEPAILESIRKMIETVHPNFQILSTATDGEEAVEILENREFDIVITDIRMPVRDGLSLLEHIDHNYPDLITVVISGYEVFGYAKKALEFHVFDYLLKPVSIPALTKLLDRLELEVEKRRAKLKEEYYHQIFSGERVPQSEQEKENGKHYQLFVFQFGSYKQLPIMEMDNANLYEKLRRQIGRELENQKYSKAFAFQGATESEYIVALEYDRDCGQQMARLVKKLYLELLRQDVPVTVIAGERLKQLNRLYENYQMLKVMLYQHLIFGRSSYYELAELKERERKQMGGGIDTQMETNLILYARSHNKKGTMKEIHLLLERLKDKTCTQLMLESALKQSFFLIERELGGETVFHYAVIEQEIRNCLMKADTYASLEAEIKEMVDILMQEPDHQKENQNELMERIEGYLNKNFYRKVNNQILSEQFGLVPSYMSMLFRKYKGMSPSDYIIYMRINKAKEILRLQPELSIRETGEMVGFQDPFYFSKVFKKETGMTPSGYRENMEESESGRGKTAQGTVPGKKAD